MAKKKKKKMERTISAYENFELIKICMNRKPDERPPKRWNDSIRGCQSRTDQQIYKEEEVSNKNTNLLTFYSC